MRFCNLKFGYNNYDATMCQSYLVPTLTVLVKKLHTLPRCGLVTIQFAIARHILCSIRSWCGFVCQGVFFLTSTVLLLEILHWLYCTQTLSYNIS